MLYASSSALIVTGRHAGRAMARANTGPRNKPGAASAQSLGAKWLPNGCPGSQSGLPGQPKIGYLDSQMGDLDLRSLGDLDGPKVAEQGGFTCILGHFWT